MLHAELAQLVQRGQRRASSFCSSTVSVISSCSRCGDRPDRRERRHDHAGTRLRLFELRRRKIDRDLDVVRPVAASAQAAAQHPLAERDD